MFCDELRKFREGKGMTATTLGKKLGVSATNVSMHERGEVTSHWRYTRKINAAFGTDFPDMSYCKSCGREITGCGRFCSECTVKLKEEKRVKKRTKTLLSAAKSADKANLSYGAYEAGLPERSVNRSTKAPEFLNLGKTIKI